MSTQACAPLCCTCDIGAHGWLVGWLLGWLVGWLISWLVSWTAAHGPPEHDPKTIFQPTKKSHDETSKLASGALVACRAPGCSARSPSPDPHRRWLPPRPCCEPMAWNFRHARSHPCQASFACELSVATNPGEKDKPVAKTFFQTTYCCSKCVSDAFR